MPANFIHPEYNEKNHEKALLDFSGGGICCGKKVKHQTIYDKESQRLVELTFCENCQRMSVFNHICH